LIPNEILRKVESVVRSFLTRDLLGRIDADRSQEIKDLIARRNSESNGFTDEEQNAFRTKNQVELNQSLAGKMRALKIAQAQSGVRGGLATAQQASALKDANRANVTNERELFLKNIDARRQGLNSYEQSLGSARKDELERQMYNQGQTSKEKYGRLGTELGYGSLGSGERSALFQKWAGRRSCLSYCKGSQGRRRLSMLLYLPRSSLRKRNHGLSSQTVQR
jgi:hypothetical protein